MEALARDLRKKLRFSGPDAEEMFILHRDASRDQTLGIVGRELLLEVRIPAQLRQFHNRGADRIIYIIGQDFESRVRLVRTFPGPELRLAPGENIGQTEMQLPWSQWSGWSGIHKSPQGVSLTTKEAKELNPPPSQPQSRLRLHLLALC